MPGACRSCLVLGVAAGGAPVDVCELFPGLAEVAGQGGGGAAGVAEEDTGAIDVQGGVLAEVVAEAAGSQGPVQVAGDLGEQVAEAGSRPGTGRR